ncbi:DUF892 family protein [Luteolibacter sp. AS25]|uniref:DUF892 family protein n=1 Tax=Luteolibacter sp. AS25 TaxID=3135776 RepID=UPI00398A93F7
MPDNSKNSFTLLDLLKEQSRDLYDAETEFSAFLGKMDRAVDNSALHELMESISVKARENIADLEEICSLLDINPNGIKCEAMAGLLREAKDTTQEFESGAVKDAALIAAAQRIAHYEIAGFGTAKSIARQLKKSDIAEMFDDMLSRSSYLDKCLSKIATGSWLSKGINMQAAEGI